MKTITTLRIGGFYIEVTPDVLEKINRAIAGAERIKLEWNGDSCERKRTGDSIRFEACTTIEGERLPLPFKI